MDFFDKKRLLIAIGTAITVLAPCEFPSTASASPVLKAQYAHEGPDPLTDDTGHGFTLVNGGSVPFSTPLSPGNLGYLLGNKVEVYNRSGSQYLGVPAGVYTPGDDFSFTAMVRKSDSESGHQTILASNRFRLQYRGTSGNQGALRLDLVSGIGGVTSESAAGSFAYNQWYYLGMTYSASTNLISAYLSNTPQFTAPLYTRTASGAGLSDMANLRLGNDGVSAIGGADPFGGQIDQVRFYQGVLSTAQLGSSILNETARYSHEAADPLTDDSGNGRTLTNGGGVSFVAPPGTTNFTLGSKVGSYPRTSTSQLDLPAGLHTSGEDFTFLGLVRKNSDETGGHQTILGSNRFRLQWTNTGTTSDGGGQLHLGVTAGGGSGSSGANTFLTDKWHLVAMTYRAATGTVDAYLQDESNFFRAPAFSFNVPGGMNDMASFRLGRDGLSGIGSPDEFAGFIDGARFFNRSFTRRELRDVFRIMNPAAGPGLVAKYDHEGGNPLTDDTGNGLTLANGGGVTFTAPTNPGNFQLGNAAGLYDRSGSDYLNVPSWYLSGDDFTFTALVRKDALESNSHETILSSNRFRLQFQNTGTNSDGQGQLYLQLNGAGPTTGATSGAGSFLTDQWYFVAMTYDAGTKSLRSYLQGDAPIFVGPKMSTTANGALGIADVSQFRIGYDGLSGLGGADGFGGHIDGIRFYDRKFSAAELRDVFRGYTSRPLGPYGLVAQYEFDGPNPLTDSAPAELHLDATNAGGVTFAAPPPGGLLRQGEKAALFNAASNSYLNVPNMHTPGDDFTFTALVYKDNSESFQTILGTDRFRFQFFGGTTNGDHSGALRLDVNGAGATGPDVSADKSFEMERWYFVALRYTSSSHLLEAFLHDATSQTLAGPVFTRTALGELGVDDMSRFMLGANGLSGIGGADAWRGFIDGARFYDMALSNAQLQDLFTFYATPEPGTMALLLAGAALLLVRTRRRSS